MKAFAAMFTRIYKEGWGGQTRRVYSHWVWSENDQLARIVKLARFVT